MRNIYLKFDLISLMDYLPEESIEVNSGVSNDDNSGSDFMNVYLRKVV